LDNKVLDIIDARCNHEVYNGPGYSFKALIWHLCHVILYWSIIV